MDKYIIDENRVKYECIEGYYFITDYDVQEECPIGIWKQWH